MKTLYTLIIIFTCTAIEVNAQLKQTKHFSSTPDGFCSQYIILDSAGYFFHGKGCEGDGTISYGIYSLRKNNIVELNYLPIEHLQPFRQIKRHRLPGNDSSISFTLFDRENRPIAHNINVAFLDSNDLHQYHYTEEDGTIVLDKNRYKDLVLLPLIQIYGKHFPIIQGEENQIEIYLNLPAIFLHPRQIAISKDGQIKKLRLKKDTLYTLKGKKIMRGI